ncbi:hypothetical protein P691DRAFT_775215 [Macrolepiota fuliginosa MF-IS2]|uniref:F-box domain-containing protein n=1 Tax=Macrolepiota fuliginosa MF-IS2 TaxID=1400762 RepID=A0A9P6C4E6_9AGAR|nr:hypothetical protein P691DRAFT_775215 [Macrolepiota fuliginosa MF-IS2]
MLGGVKLHVPPSCRYSSLLRGGPLDLTKVVHPLVDRSSHIVVQQRKLILSKDNNDPESHYGHKRFEDRGTLFTLLPIEQRTTSPPTQFSSFSLDELSDSPGIEGPIDLTALGDQVPFILRYREVATLMAASSPEERVARQQETLRLQETNRGRKLAKSLSTEAIIRPVGPTLLDLPLEILTHILLHLPSTSVVICQGVNRYLHALIFESTELQYHIHLGISGLVDNPRCDLSVAERLSLLLVRERRWEELDFDFHKVVDVTLPFKSSMTTLSAGILGGVATEECRYMQIPSAATEEVKWREIRTEQTIAMDAPGFYMPDLRVLITAQPRTVHKGAAKPTTIHDIRVHLNQLSTGEPHPDVRCTTISFETREEFETPMVTMRCAGDNMVLVLQDRGESNEPDDQVLVYEWKTGELKLRFNAPWDSYYQPMFLTTHLFLLANAATGELEYWKIPQSLSEPTLSRPFFLLSLPRLRAGNTFRYITCLAEPDAGPCNTSKPFYTNPQHAIATCYVNVLSAGSGAIFRLFVHRSSLIGCLDRFSAFTSFNEPPEPIPYDQWGPPKYILPPPPVARAHLMLLDFNPIDVAKVLATEDHLLAPLEDIGCRARVEYYGAEDEFPGDYAEMGSGYKGKDKQVALQLREASGLRSGPPADVVGTHDSSGKPRLRSRVVTRTMDALDDPEGCFEHTVYSSLPYTVHWSQDKYEFDELILDEENILGIQEDDEDNIEVIHILHYG